MGRLSTEASEGIFGNVHLSEINGLADLPIALPQFMDEIPVGLAVLDLNRKVSFWIGLWRL